MKEQFRFWVLVHPRLDSGPLALRPGQEPAHARPDSRLPLVYYHCIERYP